MPCAKEMMPVVKALRRLLGETMTVGREILYFTELVSTNTYLKRAALNGAAEGTVVIADSQTAGRGRMERSFQSPAGKGIYLSVLLRPRISAERLPNVTALAGVAVCNAVEQVCGVRPGLKWPNDPVLRNRKLGGILTELVMDERGQPNVILGIGLNVLQTAEDFSPEIAELATSLFIEKGQVTSRTDLAAALLREIDALYAALLRDELLPYLESYRCDCVNLGKAVQLIAPDGSRETAFAIGVDEQFGLTVRTETGREKTVRTGEVSVRGLYGYVE